MYSFKNKTVLVTGGANGIGYLMGLKALERGAKKLIIWDVDETQMELKSEKIQQKGYQVEWNEVDISKAEQVQKAADNLKARGNHIDVLFNNAGIVKGNTFDKQSVADIQQIMNVNSLGMMIVARAFLPDMIDKGGAYIVNIASAAGLTPNPGMAVYAASKWAAVGWSESLNLELQKMKAEVKVLTVMPSYINTGMFEGVTAPLMMPLLDPDKITTKILDAVEKGKDQLREPLMVKMTPFIKGVLPSRLYNFVAGKIVGVYSSMDTFKGREK